MLGSLRQLTKFRAPIAAARFNSTAANSKVEKKWDLMAAVVIERPPYITPKLSGLEEKVTASLDEKEFEISLMNDHELRHKRDIEKQERKKRGEEGDDGEAVITALDLEDSWKKAADSFSPSSNTMEAGLKSVKREMDRPLRLLAKYKYGSDIHWNVPYIVHNQGETLRGTAERAVMQRVGDNLNVQVLGNAPWSFYKYTYPKHYQDKTDRRGAKVWLFKGLLMNDFFENVSVNLDEGLIDYQWATRQEMQELLDKDTYKAIDNMLHDED